MNTLRIFLSRTALLHHAGGIYFERGENYFLNGHVRSVVEDEGTVVTASVRGTADYRVRLWVEGSELNHYCSCPLGDRGEFCKHCVATGLAWIERYGQQADKADGEIAGSVSSEELQAFLSKKNKKELVDLIMSKAARNEFFLNQLLLEAAMAAEGSAVGTIKAIIDSAMYVEDFMEPDEMFDLLDGIEMVLDSMEDLLETDCAGDVVMLAEYILERIERVIDFVHDEAAYLVDIIARLEDLHLRACIRKKPDPVDLAERLYSFQLHSDFGIFENALERYSEVLGDKGTAHWHKLARKLKK